MTVSIGIRACKVGAKDGHRAAPLPCDERDVLYYSNYTGTGQTEADRQIMFRDMHIPLEYLQEVEVSTGKRTHVYSPLPRRVGEMDTRVDGTPFDLSFPAMRYSVELRMALLRRLLEKLPVSA